MDDDSEPEYHQLFEYAFVVGLKEGMWGGGGGGCRGGSGEGGAEDGWGGGCRGGRREWGGGAEEGVRVDG